MKNRFNAPLNITEKRCFNRSTHTNRWMEIWLLPADSHHLFRCHF